MNAVEPMNAFDKVCHFYGQRIGVLEVREWAHVYWVSIAGKRPTMLSKKLVNRAAHLEGRRLCGDYAVRDNATGDVYAVRDTWGYTGVKLLAKGQRVSDSSDYAELRGKGWRVAPFTKPSCLRHLIVRIAVNAA